MKPLHALMSRLFATATAGIIAGGAPRQAEAAPSAQHAATWVGSQAASEGGAITDHYTRQSRYYRLCGGCGDSRIPIFIGGVALGYLLRGKNRKGPRE